MAKSKQVLVVGLGMGRLYQGVCEDLGWHVTTVDPNPSCNADYADVTDIPLAIRYDMAIICTPNYTHESIAKALTIHTKRIVVEKPGFASLIDWRQFRTNYPKHAIFMVKNNMFRNETMSFQSFRHKLVGIDLLWVNRDRVPGPGSWFTTRSKAMGGVHLDLLPHLLSVVCGILNTSYISTTADETTYRYQHYELSDLAATTWGNYDPNGTYDVEDQCYYETRHGNCQIRCAATWKMDVPKDYISWNLKFNDGSRIKFETGLCPESAYEYMLVEYMNMEMDSASYEYNVHCDEMIQDTIRSMKTEDCTTLIKTLIDEN